MDLEDVREVHQEVLSAWAELFVSDEFTKIELLGRQITGALASLDDLQAQVSAITGLTGPDEVARRRVEESIAHWKAYFNSYKKLYDKLKVDSTSLRNLYVAYCDKLEAAEAALSASPPGIVNWTEFEDAQKMFLEPLEKLQKGKEFIDRYLSDVNKQYVVLNKIADQLETVKLYTSVPRTNEELELVSDVIEFYEVFKLLLQRVGRVHDEAEYKRQKVDLGTLLHRAINQLRVIENLIPKITNTNFNSLKDNLGDLARQFDSLFAPLYAGARHIPAGMSADQWEFERFRSFSSIWPLVDNVGVKAAKMLSAYKALKAKKT